MRNQWVVIVLVIALLVLLGGCQKKNAITGRALDVAEPSTGSAISTEPKEPEQFADVTDVPTYDIKGQCTKDTKGVVRYFDNDGKKVVYRNDCVGGLLVTYDCENNQVTSKNQHCIGACKQGAYGDTCA